MAKRIRIFFINCPTLDVDATSYLILAQNKVQTALQFEVHHFWLYAISSGGKPAGAWNRLLCYRQDSLDLNWKWRERKYRRALDLRSAPFFKSAISLGKW